MIENYLTTEQASKLLHVSAYTVRVYVKQGLLKATRIGRQYLIGTTEIERLLKGEAQ